MKPFFSRVNKCAIIPFSSNQENGSQMTFVAGGSKIPKKVENLAMIEWLDAGNNAKASII